MAAGDGEKSALGQFVKKQAGYGTTTTPSSRHKNVNDRFFKHNIQTNETIQGIALKYGVTVEQIKRTNNIWTNDSLFVREFLLIPIETDIQPTTSTASRHQANLEIVTKQELTNASTNKHPVTPTADKTKTVKGDSESKSCDSGTPGLSTDNENMHDFLSKMDTSLATLRQRARHLDKVSDFPEDQHNPLNLLPKKPAKYGRRTNSHHSTDSDSFELTAEPELAFRSNFHRQQGIPTTDNPEQAETRLYHL